MAAFYGNNWLLAIPFAGVCILQVVWFLIKGKGEVREGRARSVRTMDLLVCACVAFTVGTLLYQYPGTKVPAATDSSVFLYIGKQMHAGKVPYVDLFDHKGPLLYAIQYLGYAIMPHAVVGGIWFLELITYMVTAWFMLKTARLVSEDDRSGYLALMMVLISCGFKMYMGGNFTEEHALPWIVISAWIFYRFFLTKEYTAFEIFALGFSCMAVLLLQVNLVTVWAAFVPVVLIMLLREKRFGDVGKCILFFVLGLLALLIPVLIWAWRGGFLQAMWDVYIRFNFEYSDKMTPDLHGYLELTKSTLNRIWPGMLAMIAALFCDRKDRKKNTIQWLNLWLVAVSVVMTQVSGRDSPYYRLVILPALVIPFVRFFDLLWRLYGHGKTQRKNDALVVLSCLLMVGAAAVHRYRSNLQNPEDVVVVRYVKENTEQTDTILTIGNYAWPYIAADRTTENRFFFQWPPIQVSDALYEEFLEELRVHPSDFVILPEAENSELQIPGEGKIDDALSMLEEMGYQKEQYDGFRVYLAPGKTDGNQ